MDGDGYRGKDTRPHTGEELRGLKFSGRSLKVLEILC
jgi:hypothetical protein